MLKRSALVDQALSEPVNYGARLIAFSENASEPSRSRKDFLCTLFSSLDSNQVRYCVLHSWEELPQDVSSDLDMAVHARDSRKLTSVFRCLQGKGYTPVQIVNYFVDAYCFRFIWFDGSVINSLAVDIIFKHQRGALTTPSVKLLVCGRRRHGIFWIPAPEAEFTYLLARKSWKGIATVEQQLRLKLLVEQLGRPTAERLAGELVGELKVRIVEACASGRLNPLLARIRPQVWKTSLLRSPLGVMADLFFEGIRLVRRWCRPTGLLVSIMGPDGAGKSTLVEHLVQAVTPAFDRHKLFHWRPMLLWRRKVRRDTTRPHSLPPHSGWWSVGRLFAHLVDYWAGYWFVIRPVLAQSGLVVFDRYFDDVWIDPKRYRYGGPLSLVRIMRPLIPKPDLVLVLDAPHEVFFSRKQEVAPEEVERQRRLYSEYQKETANSRVIDATASVTQVTSESTQAIFEFLAQRSALRYARWLSPSQT